ncbi:DUF190 domain-containing protein [Aquimonas voraii]|uniref:PII-like signaling protein n=1 Tax=Aquimonas voraii TaxID=265719 RepID=A0A1G6SZD9_9GAMM|nr:DUF190 domain-containing protein [Aquimonas voraii]SDD22119.1 PII-like signaling protein [Aquimonas voraii]
MNGWHLRFYTYENRKHGGLLVYEWLLEQAKRMGIRGGSAFRAIAGYGRDGRLHEQHFFELAGEQPVLVEFVVTEVEARDLLALLSAHSLHLFYSRQVTEYGVVGDSG